MKTADPHPQRLVLASASPRRSELLQRIGLRFEVCPADVEELNTANEGPQHMVLYNAAIKAEALAARFADGLVLGSDTTVALDGGVLNKPVDMDEARAMLQRLSGREHTVYTAVALRWLDGNFAANFVEASRVRFKRLDDVQIRAYFDCVNPLDKAGAYGIQAGREMIIEAVEGSVENVMGLPIQALQGRLAQYGFNFQLAS
jgi:septum formation protein